jgi:serine/threonine protein kinase
MSLRHPNIVTFIGYSIYKNDFYFVTEYMTNKSLKNVIENKKIKLSLSQKLKMCLDISLAIYYLHSRTPKVYHRDLKSSNCLVDEYYRIKLCDFGISKIHESKNINIQTNSSSTCFWMAPEFLLDGIFTDKSDIYSLGILFWEIFSSDTVPYKNINEVNFFLGDLEVLKMRPIFNNDLNSDIKDLITNCWDMDYQKRPSIDKVVVMVEGLINKFGEK